MAVLRKARPWRIVIKDGMKTCKNCGVTKPETDFGVRAERAGGRRSKCKACEKAYMKANKNKSAIRSAKWRMQKPDRAAEVAALYRNKNIEKDRARVRNYRKLRPDVSNRNCAARRSRKMQATPAWANHEAIASVYAECARITAETGIVHHVDHIVPLKGRNVCGLHVENNLQILVGVENLSKGNRYE